MDNLVETSSSSDEEDVLNLLQRNTYPGIEGLVWDVVHAYTETNFKNNFRISRKSATYLIQKYTESCSKRIYKGGREQASAEMQILCFLWFSGNKTSYREVGNIFGMSFSNVNKCFNNVLMFLVDTMAPKIITELKTIEVIAPILAHFWYSQYFRIH